MSFFSIVVPVYHNAKSLPTLLDKFKDISKKNIKDKFEFVFVDDGSKDNSLKILKDLSVNEKRIKIIKLSRNFGSTAATIAGLSQAKGDAVVVIAADLQDPPELINKMIFYWKKGNKVVLAARKSRKDPTHTVILSNVFYWLFRHFAITSMPHGGFDFFLIDKQVQTLINEIPETNTYLVGLILWLGFNPKVIYYNRKERDSHYGHSMWTTTKKIKHFIDSFVAFSYLPLRASSLLGIILSILGISYAIIVIIARLFFGIHAEGWASIMVVLLVVSGVQFLMMGILGEYLWRNLDETRKRPRFIIDSVIKRNSLLQNEKSDK